MSSQPQIQMDGAAFQLLPDMRLEGDFYREQMDVHRGVTLSGGMSEMDPFRAFEMDEPCYGAPGKADACKSGPVKSLVGSAADACGASRGADATAIFDDSIQAPAVEASRFFGDSMPATSLVVQTESAAALAKSLHAFLAGEPGQITKLSPQKFAIKADVFQTVNGNLLHCTLKARVYRCSEPDASQKLLVEFCRRSGDAIAFQRAVARATDHVLGEFTAASEVSEATLAAADLAEDALLAPPTVDGVEEPMLTPLMDMLQCDALPAEQAQRAEAIAALAALAIASTASALAVGAALGQLQPPGVLQACAASRCAHVSFPAARLELALKERRGFARAC